MNGIVIVDKPQGWTSQDVTAKLRGVFHERRVGHGGTLDPMATGVLPVFFGRATRAVPFFENAEKEYLVGLRLGVVTDTQDITGSVLSESEAELSEDTLRAALQKMQGLQMQLPPMYSAIKIHGKKLYELAREGKDAERTPRPVELKSWSFSPLTERMPFFVFSAARALTPGPSATIWGSLWAAVPA